MSTSGQSETWLFLAMAHAKNGDLGAASQSLEKATQEKPDQKDNVWRRQTYQLLLREAREVLDNASDSVALETSANGD